MALLQGFPDDYVFEGRLASRYNQVGDAVPPLVSTHVAAHVAEVIDGTAQERVPIRPEQLSLAAS